MLNLDELHLHCGSTKEAHEVARKALDGIPKKGRRKWGWGWKHPATMYHVAELQSVFPCLHLMHVIRDPRDMASVPTEHLGNRAYVVVKIANLIKNANDALQFTLVCRAQSKFVLRGNKKKTDMSGLRLPRCFGRQRGHSCRCHNRLITGRH